MTKSFEWDSVGGLQAAAPWGRRRNQHAKRAEIALGATLY
jgi:hypothetical protein